VHGTTPGERPSHQSLFCFLDSTREALSGMLREGRAGSNTTADHITVLDQALTQIPDSRRHGTPILIRYDSAGCTFGLLAHIRGLRALGVDARFSVGVAITEPIRQATLTAKTHGTWAPLAMFHPGGDPAPACLGENGCLGRVRRAVPQQLR
jgi:hypothetical protein